MNRNGVIVSSEKFRALRGAMTSASLAERIGSTSYQLWRLTHGRPTSFRFLIRLVPIFGLNAVAEIIADDQHRKEFIDYAAVRLAA